MRYRVRSITSTFTLVLGTFGASVAPVALASLTVGCGILGSPGPSAVSQGQKYQSGDPTFDEFFSNVYDLQIDLAKAPESEKKIRQDLAKKVKLDEGSSASMLSKKLGKRTEDLAAAGTGVKLEVKGLEAGEEASAAMSVKGKDLSADDKEMVDAVEEAAKEAVKLYGRMAKAKKILEQFNTQILALEQTVDSAFRKGGPSKKAEVRKNLDDVKKLAPLMAARADEVSESAKTLVKKLVEVASTDDGHFDAPPPPPPEEPAPPEEKPPEKGEKKGEKGEKKGEKGEKKPAPPVDKPPPTKPPADFEP